MAKEGWKAPALLRCVTDPEQQLGEQGWIFIAEFWEFVWWIGGCSGCGADYGNLLAMGSGPWGRWIYVCD
jgi:hypothetical protein